MTPANYDIVYLSFLMLINAYSQSNSFNMNYMSTESFPSSILLFKDMSCLLVSVSDL